MKKAVCHDVAALFAAGASIQEIMRLTGLSRCAVEYRLDRAMPPPKRMERRCLCCGRPFMSDGPMNRMCGSCRKKAADVSPYTPDVA